VAEAAADFRANSKAAGSSPFAESRPVVQICGNVMAKKTRPKSKPARGRGGRPTLFKSEYIAQARALCEYGATDVELADFFNVSDRTIYRWSAGRPEFCQALKIGKAAADARVERSLYHRATGYTHDAVKIFPPRGLDGVAVKVAYREHVPPDVSAAIFWLTNRQSDKWRHKSVQELVGKDGGPIEHSEVSAIEKKRLVAALILTMAAGRSRVSQP
jgi:hypothetical protein